MAIDPSFSGCGITCFDNGIYQYFLIKTTKSSKNSIDITRRIIYIKSEVKKIIKDNDIKSILMEGPSFGSQSSAIVQMGALNHMLRELFIEMNIPFAISPPTVVKKFFTGKGNCGKPEMIAEAMARGANIPFTEKVKGEILPDNNVVDSFAMNLLLQELLNNPQSTFKDVVEWS
jgi:Holliday junction resolvasome RuvABC endonuclease subunit